MMSNDGRGSGGDWHRGSGGGGPSAPRPPILSVNPFGGSGGGGMPGGGAGGFGGGGGASQQQSYTTDRFDAYKNPMMGGGQKRY